MRMTDRRKEPRVPADEALQLFLDGTPAAIEGRLVDTSRHGFRAVHGHLGLNSGCDVRFRDAEREGTARVMWNRVAGGVVETGFLVLGPGE